MGDQKKAYEERLKRVDDAIALKEPDRVPIAPFTATFPYHLAGYTCSETNYDLEKTFDAFRQFITRYDPDMVTNPGKNMSGQMPLLDQMGMSWLQWSGQKNTSVPDTISFQCLDKEFLLEDEYQEFLNDNTKWTINKYLPRAAEVFKPLQNISFDGMYNYAILPMTMQFASPEILSSLKTLSETAMGAIQYYTKSAEFEKEIQDMGYVVQIAATTCCSYDTLSTLRGTIGLMMDILEQEEEVLAAVEKLFPGSLYSAIGTAARSNGRLIMIPLTSGMDNFLSNDNFEKFYWPTLLRLINGLVDAGLTPWIYSEGKFNTRYEFLKQIPKGKCLIHFEDADLKLAKAELGDIACLSGGINSVMLQSGTPESVEYAIRENMEILAPGGGYIFDVGNCLDICDPKLVDVMFNTLHKYGNY